MNSPPLSRLEESVEESFSQNQVTIARPIEVTGANFFWDGSHIEGIDSKGYPETAIAIFRPAKVNSGIQFKVDGGLVPATLANAVFRYMGIGLDNGGKSVNVVEHLMSSIYPLNIDNLEIELLNSWENLCPITDNYAKEYIDALVGERIAQPAAKQFLSVEDRGKLCYVVSYKPGTKTPQLETMTEDEFMRTKPHNALLVRKGKGVSIRYRAGYPHKVIGEQKSLLKISLANYRDNIQDARSIAFRDAMIGDPFPIPMKVEDVMKLGEEGRIGFNERNLLYVGGVDDPNYLNTFRHPVRHFGKEFVKHKIQDVIGELMLVGRMKDVYFHYVKTGHEFHLAAHRLILSEGVLRPYLHS